MVSINKTYLYIIFLIIVLWDVLDYYIPNSPLFLLLAASFVVFQKGLISLSKKGLILFFLYVCGQGLVNIIIGNDDIKFFVIQIGTVAVSLIVFAGLLANYGIKEVFKGYLFTSFVVALIACVQQAICVLNFYFLTKVPLLFLFTNYKYKVMGMVKVTALMKEPSFLAYFLAPAAFYCICSIIAPEFTKDNKVGRIKIIAVLAAYVMTFSAVAYFGLMVFFVLIWLKKRTALVRIILPIVAITAALLVYSNVNEIKVRVDDTLGIFANQRSNQSVNLSTYTYHTSSQVVKRTFTYTKGLGAGLGGYRVMYDKFSPEGWGANHIQLNKEDANSAFFRISAELGIIGLLSVLLFLIGFFPWKDCDNVGLALSCLALIIMFLLRQGNYTHGGSLLFVCMYAWGNKTIFKLSSSNHNS